jgi:hypothetical protein
MDMSGELHTRVALHVLEENDYPRQPVKIHWAGLIALLDGFEDSLLNMSAIKQRFLVIQSVA